MSATGAIWRRKIVFFLYLVSGILAVLGGILTSAKTMSFSMSVGDGMEMDALTAVVIGGTSIMGGTGSIGKTIIGVLIFFGVLVLCDMVLKNTLHGRDSYAVGGNMDAAMNAGPEKR